MQRVFVLVPGQRGVRRGRKRRKRDALEDRKKRRETTLTMTMPAYRFDPVFFASFLLCLLFERKWRTVHCWGKNNNSIVSGSAQCPLVFFIFSLLTKKGGTTVTFACSSLVTPRLKVRIEKSRVNKSVQCRGELVSGIFPLFLPPVLHPTFICRTAAVGIFRCLLLSGIGTFNGRWLQNA